MYEGPNDFDYTPNNEPIFLLRMNIVKIRGNCFVHQCRTSFFNTKIDPTGRATSLM